MAKLKYNHKLINEVLDKIAEGRSPMELYQKDPNLYPTSALIAKWVNKKMHGDFAERYWDARKIGMEVLADKLHYMRDNPPKYSDYDKYEYTAEFNKWKLSLQSLQKELNDFAKAFDDRYNVKQKKDITSSGGVMHVHTMDWASVPAMTKRRLSLEKDEIDEESS